MSRPLSTSGTPRGADTVESGGVKGRGPHPRPCTCSMTTAHSTPGRQGPCRGVARRRQGTPPPWRSQCLFPEAVRRRKAGCIQPVKRHAGPAPISAGSLHSTPTEEGDQSCGNRRPSPGGRGAMQGARSPPAKSPTSSFSSAKAGRAVLRDRRGFLCGSGRPRTHAGT